MSRTELRTRRTIARKTGALVGCLIAQSLATGSSFGQEAPLASSTRTAEADPDEESPPPPPPPPAASWRASPSGSSEPVRAATESEEAEGPCSIHSTRLTMSSKCSTPRDGVLSGIYLGADVGPARLDEDAAERVGAGGGVGVHVRFAVELWDHLLLGIGIAGLILQDHRPITESVVDCTAVNGVIVSCGDQPHSEGSSIGATLFTTELGLQHRFRPWTVTSWTPGLVTGYQAPTSNLERSVNCDGCRSIPLDATAAGAYLAPFFRVTIGPMGFVALVARWQLYLSGDVAQVPSVGIEGGLP